MRVWPEQLEKLHRLTSVAIAILTAILTWPVPYRPFSGIILGVVAGGIYYYVAMQKYIQRRKFCAEPFPINWRNHLNRCVPFYRKLDDTAKINFENDVRIFLAEQKIFGLRGAPAEEEVKVLIAASAAILGHGLPNWEWPAVRDIIVYPMAFNEDYTMDNDNYIAGLVHQQGPIIFSERDIKHGFCKRSDGYNVGLHELAHVMDMANGAADGIPAGMSWIATAPWINIMSDRIRKVRENKTRNILRSYAGVNESEFFAVAVEVFFEQPEKLQQKDPELYQLLAEYFNVNPVDAKPLKND